MSRLLAYGHRNKREIAGRQVGLLKDDIDEVGEKFWLTPPDVLRRFDEEFHFDFDACPFPRPAGFDALQEEWGLSTYANPPIGKGHSLSAWVKKGSIQAQKGKTVVMILPMPHWFRYLLKADAEFRYPGPIRFLNPQGKQTRVMGGGRVPDILAIMRPRTSPVTSRKSSKAESGGAVI